MTIIPMLPSATVLEGDLQAGEEAIARARAAVGAAGEGASAIVRVSLYLRSADDVKAVAKQWGTPVLLGGGGAYCVTRTGSPHAMAEAVACGSKDDAEKAA